MEDGYEDLVLLKILNHIRRRMLKFSPSATGLFVYARNQLQHEEPCSNSVFIAIQVLHFMEESTKLQNTMSLVTRLHSMLTLLGAFGNIKTRGP